MATPTIPRVIDGVCACSVCCHRVWTSMYDCDTGLWSALALVSSTTIAGPCPSDITWRNVDSHTPCVYQYDQYQSLTLCQSCSDVSPVPPAGPTSGAPTDCCGDNCCEVVWISEFDCIDSTWSTPSVFSTNPYQPCSADIDWAIDPLYGDCAAFYVQYSTPGDCTGAIAPPPPVFYPPDCCTGDCCYIRFVTTYDCESSTWSTPMPFLDAADQPCQVSGDWVPYPGLGPCAMYKDTWGMPGDCSSYTTPDVPTSPPDPECCLQCCQWTWVAYYDCDTATWDIISTDADSIDCATGVNTGWVNGSSGSCTATRQLFSTDDPFCENPPDPGLPSGAPPGCCPSSCVECAGTQPPIVVSGLDFPCGGTNGSRAYSGFVFNQWYWDFGNLGVLVDCNPDSNIITAVSVTSIFGTITSVSLVCIGGLVTGTATGIQNGIQCNSGNPFTITFN